MKLNKYGDELIRGSEGCVLYTYDDKDPSRPKKPVKAGATTWRGVLTIGYGHTGKDVVPGLTWTQEQADAAYASDVQKKAGNDIEHLVKVPLSENQYNALLSFVFNLGAGALRQSHLLVFLNLKDYNSAQGQFPIWDHWNGAEAEGLYRRRLKEQRLWRAEDGEAPDYSDVDRLVKEHFS